MKKSKYYKLFEEYIKYYEPSFQYDTSSNSWYFCYDMDCENCILKDKCDSILFFPEEEYNQTKLEYPEYFI